MEHLSKFCLLLLTFLFFSAITAVAQSGSSIEQLENEMRSAAGAARVQKLIELADACLAEGQYKEALQWAEEAEGFAKKLKLPEWRAAALNREGKALTYVDKRSLFGKEKAAPRFTQSNEILQQTRSNNKALAMDNLENLLALAQKAGRDNEATQLRQQIENLRNGYVAAIAPPEAPVVPLTRQELREELTHLQKELARTRGGNTATQADWERKSREMEAQLVAKEEAINQMSQAQMRAELLLLEQHKLVDSLTYLSSLDSLSIANTQLQLKETQARGNLYYLAMIALLLLTAGAVFSLLKARQYNKTLEEKNKIIRVEQERSENLLLNILPALVAEELKKQGRTHARYFEDVSVLFADFIGFSKIAEQLTPQQLVTELDTCFQAFDAIIERYGLEKIKTIGDAYMCAGGLPNGGGSKTRDMINAAREMQSWLAQWNLERDRKKQPRFDARIGIHAGPVVAGVVGSRKFAFDIWGDTVNIAARVEQAGEGGKINITGAVYDRVKEHIRCSYRGKIAAKNKGEIDMFFVDN